MSTDTLANRYRPKMFSDVVGQENEIEVLAKITSSPDRPNAVMFTGPFGTGKTTLGRLTARAILCENKVWSKAQLAKPEAERGRPIEPCGQCEDCRSMDRENHPNYFEVDAASQGAVSDVRAMREQIAYRSGSKPKILCYDESHMLSNQAQNALLQILEDGSENVLFLFCTTASNKMLPTVKSRCVELQMKLLRMEQIAARLTQIAETEKITIDERALKVLATYVRGHARDAIVLFEQLAKLANPITEDLVRKYLKLDRYEEVYKLMLEKDRKAGILKLEELLCIFAPSELAECIGETLLNTYKLSQKLDSSFTAFEKAWLEKILEARGPDNLLAMAEATLTLRMDYATLSRATVALANILLEGKTIARPGIAKTMTASSPPIPAVPSTFRKPGK